MVEYLSGPRVAIATQDHGVQGYLAHKKTGPRGVRFLMSEVLLYG